jgi:outer membrane protein OmpA-like peptidoglycan-associated protein
MFRSREYVPAVLAGILLAGTPAAASQDDDVTGVVHDLYFTVESLDGSETVERGKAQVTITLNSDVLFEFDESDLTPEARDRLATVAEDIRADGAGGAVTIAGHTDDQGSDSYNQRLSQRRAESVQAELARLLTGEDVELETIGHGESQPRVPNSDEQNRAKNRRVEITYDVRQ